MQIPAGYEKRPMPNEGPVAYERRMGHVARLPPDMQSFEGSRAGSRKGGMVRAARGRETRNKVLAALSKTEYQSSRMIGKAIGMHQSSALYHVRALLDEGLVHYNPTKGYRLK